MRVKSNKCFYQIDAKSLQKLSLEFTSLEFFPLAFKPIIDDFSRDPFVPKDPWQIIESGEFLQVNLEKKNTFKDLKTFFQAQSYLVVLKLEIYFVSFIFSCFIFCCRNKNEGRTVEL